MTKELAIDAMNGTNSAGCDIFAALAEIDGSEVPLGYLFVQKLVSSGSAISQVPGKISQILEKSLVYC